MKHIASVVFIILWFTAALTTQSNVERYVYRVSGRVIFKKNQSPPGATVYVMGTRPINGRIPWTHAAKDGTFAIEFSDAPDDFRVCAHPGDTGGRLPVARTPEQAKKMAITSCTEDFRLDVDHREKRVELRVVTSFQEECTASPSKPSLEKLLPELAECASREEKVLCFKKDDISIIPKIDSADLVESVLISTSCLGINGLTALAEQIIPKNNRGKFLRRVSTTTLGACRTIYEEEYECLTMEYSQDNCHGCVPAAIKTTWKR